MSQSISQNTMKNTPSFQAIEEAAYWAGGQNRADILLENILNGMGVEWAMVNAMSVRGEGTSHEQMEFSASVYFIQTREGLAQVTVGAGATSAWLLDWVPAPVKPENIKEVRWSRACPESWAEVARLGDRDHLMVRPEGGYALWLE